MRRRHLGLSACKSTPSDFDRKVGHRICDQIASFVASLFLKLGDGLDATTFGGGKRHLISSVEGVE